MKKIFFNLAVIFLSIECFSTEFFDLQKDFSNGNFRVSSYLNYSEFTSVFKNIEDQQVFVTINGNQYSYFSKNVAEYSNKTFFNSYKISLTYKTKFIKNFFTNVKVGILYNKSLVFESSSDKLTSSDKDNNFGLNISAGVGYILFPETFVNPSIIAVLNVDSYGLNFNTLNNNIVNTSLTIYDYCAGITITKNISSFLYPYLGTKLILRKSEFVDKVSNHTITGENFLFTINLGNIIHITKKSCLNIEYSWSPKDFVISFGFLIPNIIIEE